MKGEVFEPTAQHEGLAHNPILTLMETISMLNTHEYPDQLIEQQHVNKAHQEMFHFHGEKKELFFTVSPFDLKKHEAVRSHEKAHRFVGFENLDKKWFLRFESEEDEIALYEPIAGIVDSSQIQNIREITIRDNS